MKYIVKHLKSEKIFVVDSPHEYQKDESETVTLRDPYSGEIKTVKRTTFKRSYKHLTEEEMKMANETMLDDVTAEVNAPVVSFEEILNCGTRDEFINALSGKAAYDWSEVTSVRDKAYLTKAYNNAKLTFRENMQRFIANKDAALEAIQASEASPEDPDLATAAKKACKDMQKYTDKMMAYISKADAVKTVLNELSAVVDAEETETVVEAEA